MNLLTRRGTATAVLARLATWNPVHPGAVRGS